MSNNDLIDKLSKLELEQTSLKRHLESNVSNRLERHRTFEKIKKNEKEIEKIKFKLRLERKIRNENNNTK